MAVPRDLTPAERHLMAWLLRESGADGRYSEQLRGLVVVDECDCGCPSVSFAPRGSSHRAIGSSVILTDTSGQISGGSVTLLVHVINGELAMLEVIGPEDVERFALPLPEQLAPPRQAPN